MEECKWNFKFLGHYFRLTKSNKFIIIGKKEGQWVETFKLNIVYIKFEYWGRKETKWFDWVKFSDFKLLTLFKFFHCRITKTKEVYDNLPQAG